MSRSLRFVFALIVGFVGIARPVTLLAQCTPTLAAIPDNVICSNSKTLVMTFQGATNIKWYKNGTLITGQSGTSLTVGPGSGTANYYCTAAKNGCGGTPTSNTITITDNTPVASIAPSGPTVICPGTSGVTMNAQPGSGYTYQWTKDNTPINLANTSSYTAAIAGVYRCTVSNGCGSVTSNSITLTQANHSIPVVSASGNICSASSVTLTATNTPSSSSYIWYKNGASVMSYSTNTPYVTNTPGVYKLMVPVSGCQTFSNEVTVADITPVASISTPGSTIICPGSTGVPMTAQSAPNYTFRWTKDGTTIPGATTATYTAPAAGTYRCVVSNVTPTGTCGPVTSNSIVVTVNTSYSPPVIAKTGSLCNGSGSVTINATSLPTGVSTYAWYRNGVSVQNGTTYTPYVTSTPGVYKLFIVKAPCTSFSNEVVVEDSTPLATISGALGICSGEEGTLLSAQPGYSSYLWFKNGSAIENEHSSSIMATTEGAYSAILINSGCAKPSNTINVSVVNVESIASNGNTTCDGQQSILTAAPGHAGYSWYRNGVQVQTSANNSIPIFESGTYYAKVQTANCTGTSNSIFIPGGTSPSAVLSSTGSPSICEGNSVELTATSYTGGTYQWLKDDVAIANTSTSSFTVSEIGNYTVKITDNQGGGCSSTSDIYTVSEGASPTATISGRTTICDGQTEVLNAPTGEGYSYEWFKYGALVEGATTSSLEINSGGQYQVRIISNGCSSMSPFHSVMVQSIPVSILGLDKFCPGGTTQLSAAAQGPALSYEWFQDDVHTGVITKKFDASSSGAYKVQVTDMFGCRFTSTPKNITEYPLPVAVVNEPSSTIVCQGAPITMEAIATAGNIYQWQKNGENINGATNSVFEITTPGTYRIVVSDEHCQATSDTIRIDKKQFPATTIDGKKYFCTDDSTVLHITPLPGYTYQWLKNHQILTGETKATLHLDESAYVQVLISDGICSDTVASAFVTELPIPSAATGLQGDTLLWTGQRELYTVIDSTNADGFSWSVPSNAVISYSDPKQSKVQISFSTAGTHQIKVFSRNGGCWSLPFVGTITVDGTSMASNKIPEEVKVGRDRKVPVEETTIPKYLADVHEGVASNVFEGCVEGRFFVGFKLQYDLGDRNTTQNWSVFLQISLLHKDDTLWTKPLQVDMNSQTFIATVFHDSAIACTEDYRFVVKRKYVTGNAPEGNVYIKTLLFKQEQNNFNPAYRAALFCNIISAETNTVSWTYSKEDPQAGDPQEFDLEWVFIGAHERFTETIADSAFAFKEPVGVTISAYRYDHKIFYPDGKLWYRVRAVGYNPEFPEHRILGRWSYGACAVNTVTNQEPQRNWQEQTVFAEEGKYKKVLNYFDGSLRQRQAQTNLSSEKVTVVGESFYDFEGRQAINMLAVPATTGSLRYRSAFNTFTHKDSVVEHRTSTGLNKFHYDNYRTINSTVSTGDGAGKYYSPENESNGIHRDLIPDGEGYVYSQTEYTNDGTGRVSRQSGVGKAFAHDGDHVTKYYYGTASPAELIRLFGSNVGNAAHYKKNLAVDPNGQVGVTYVDQEGRTIATALAGDPPANVDSLTSFKNLLPLQPLTVDISNKNKKENGLSVISHTILNESYNTQYAFKYDLSAYGSQVSMFGCKTCVFDLMFTIVDPDGNTIKLDTVKDISAESCTSGTNRTVQFDVLFKEIGDYTVTKTLLVHDLSFEEMKTIISQDETVKSAFELIKSTYTVNREDCEICTSGPQADQAIEDAIQEIAQLDCENIYNQIVQYYRDRNNTGEAPYEVPQDSIEDHALYCKYLACIKDKESDIFEKQFSRINTWSEAVNKGYSNLFAVDPFFQNPNLSGYSKRAEMQSKLNDVFVASIGYDVNNDRVADGYNEFRGPIAQVTDPNNIQFLINANGVPDANGKHLLFLDLQNKRFQLTDAAYHQELNELRWTMYKGFYLDAKRRVKLSAYSSCPKLVEELEATDELPAHPDSVRVWAEANGVMDSVSVEELESSLMSLRSACGNKFLETDSAAIVTHLKNYFNSNKQNFLRLIFTSDLGKHNDLIAIENILRTYSCSLDSVDQVDPLMGCVRDTTITVPRIILPALRDSNLQSVLSSGFSTEQTLSGIPMEKEVSPSDLASEKYELARVARRDSLIIELQKQLNFYDQEDSAQTALRSGTLDARQQRYHVSTFSSTMPDPEEYAALLALYAATNDKTISSGPTELRTDWYDQTGWDAASPDNVDDVGSWYGVTTDEEGHVTALRLQNNRLKGELPSELADLKWLTYLDLGNNELTGAIPEGIGQVSTLQWLAMGDNSLNGSIPETFSNLHELKFLDLKNNNITGNFESVCSLESLEYLNLSSNLIDSVSNAIGGLSSMKYIDLSHNVIDDGFPSSILNIVSLEELYIQSNHFKGQLPDPFSMANYDFSDNNFTGLIPASYGELVVLRLSNNKLTGFAPDYQQLVTAASVDIDGNDISGPLPDNMFIIWSGTGGDISGNKFTFSDLKQLLCYGGDPGSVNYAPQDSVDVKKQIALAPSITLTATIDRAFTPACTYQWFKYVDGINDIPLNAPTISGHTTSVTNGVGNVGRYYYKVTHSLHQCDQSLDELELVSRFVDVVDDPTMVNYEICLEHDSNNPTVKKFSYTIDWNKEVEKCIAIAEEANTMLTEYAIEKLVEDYITEYYNNARTQCLNRVKEKLDYTFTAKEYHYTLYYYDQAKNLIQTVPPEGVHPLTASQVAAFLAGTKTEPKHNLITRYEYGSLNQLVWQKTPDAGESNFYYNDKAQLKLSQNAQQHKDSKYSYTRYDEQGRVVEVGEMETSKSLSALMPALDSLSFPIAGSDVLLADITRTHYDFADNSRQEKFQQRYLRTRVSYVEVFEKDAIDTIATYYTYDVHGNVKSVVQRVPGLSDKRTDYVYDLVSGKVNYLFYQYGKHDQFSHKYFYDSDNRLKEVFTSTDRFLWNKEALYDYYQHGPLARVELGAYRSQSVDYYYTLQGWIKGVNQPYADDPDVENISDRTAGKDAYAYALGYFENDYKAINAGFTTTDQRDHLWTRQNENHHHTGLYNGNISWMVTDLAKIGEVNHDRTKGMQAMLYKYDQLHRITKSLGLTNYSATAGFEQKRNNAYDESYRYDGNGNILALDRMNAEGQVLHDYDYYYYKNSNKLRGVLPIVRDTTYASTIHSNNKLYKDITLKSSARPEIGVHTELRATQNIMIDTVGGDFDVVEGNDFAAYIPEDGPFVYDAIGNLIADQEEGSKVNWTAYGKLREVRTKNDSVRVKFRYDATGNRIEKRVEKFDTVMVTRYLRDASGMVMSIYSDTTVLEVPMYGSERLGMYHGVVAEGMQTLGRRSYEISNHLGNVLTVISDNIEMGEDSAWCSVMSTSDYYPFGLDMPGRCWRDTTSLTSRYGFNGKEKDNSGELGDTHYDYGFRIYNPTIAKFLSVDPLTKEYPWYSPYQFAGNKPIKFIDLDGQEPASTDSKFYFDKGMSCDDVEDVLEANIANYAAINNLQASSLEISTLYDDADDADDGMWWLRRLGHDWASRNVAKYLLGKGGVDVYGFKQLTGASEFDVLLSRQNDALAQSAMDRAQTLGPGQSEDYEIPISYSSAGQAQRDEAFTDYTGALGQTQMIARGLFKVSKDENGNVSFSGDVFYTFYDTYDWNPNHGFTPFKWMSGVGYQYQYHNLMKVGAKIFYSRAYFSGSLSGTLGNYKASGYADSFDSSNHIEPQDDVNCIPPTETITYDGRVKN